MKKIILASASPRRRELLTKTGFSFEVMVSQTDENIPERDPEKLVAELSRRKAMAVAEAVKTETLIIGADTIVAFEGEIMGKPADEAEAFRMLKALSGKVHQVYTGVTLITSGREESRNTFVERTDVTMYPISDEEILAYIATGEPMDKAGAYGIQGRAAIFVREIKGDYNNVVGLPAARLYQEMKEWLKK